MPRAWALSIGKGRSVDRSRDNSLMRASDCEPIPAMSDGSETLGAVMWRTKLLSACLYRCVVAYVELDHDGWGRGIFVDDEGLFWADTCGGAQPVQEDIDGFRGCPSRHGCGLFHLTSPVLSELALSHAHD